MAEKSISELQAEIVEEFSLLAGDKESTIFYIMELGQQMPGLAEEHQVEGNIIKGCQSKVWLVSQLQADGTVTYQADSNTEITKGLISLLIRVLSGQPAEQIVQADLDFITHIGMGNIIGSQRSNGLASMIKQMKLEALAYSAQVKDRKEAS